MTVEPELDAWIEAERRRANLPGLQLAVVAIPPDTPAGDTAAPVLDAAWGLADRRTRRPLEPTTPMRAGSLTKLVTAVTALSLVEDGLLELDRPISALDPGLRLAVPFAGAEPVTVRHLLAHTSGLPRGPYAREPLVDAERLARLGELPLVFPPGSRRKYSNLGYLLAGAVMARAAGTPFPALVAARALAPLGIAERGAIVEPGAPIATHATLATGYHRAGQYRPLIHRHHRLVPVSATATALASAPAPACGLITTAGDYARLLAALIRAGEPLSAAGWATLAAPQPAPHETPLPVYGLGLRHGTRLGRTCLWHNAGDAGFSALWIAFLEAGVAGVTLTNRASAQRPLEAILQRALAPHLGLRPPRRPGAISEKRGTRYAGRYVGHRGDGARVAVTVEAASGGLRLRHRGRRHALEPYGGHRFACPRGPFREHLLRFVVDGGDREDGGGPGQRLVWGCRVGPHELWRDLPLRALMADGVDPTLPDRRARARLAPCAGVYARPGFGDARVFLRREGLTVSSYYGEEVALEPAAGVATPGRLAFRIAGGWLDGEPAVFHLRSGELELGHMRFGRRESRPADLFGAESDPSDESDQSDE